MSLDIRLKKLKAEVKLPSYAHPGDVGLDLYSLERYTIKPGGHHIFFLGFALEFPDGYGAFVKDKGSIALAGLHTMGGVFDAGYRGEYNVKLVNLGDKDFTFEVGDKIAQLVIFPIQIASINVVAELAESSRGEGKWGSTGRK